MRRTLMWLIATSLMIGGPTLAQEAAEGRRSSHCIAYVEDTPGFEVIRAAPTDELRTVDYRSVVPPETVRISYIDHAMFLIQTPGGLSVVTDYSGFIGPTEFIPDIVTMNHAHGWSGFSLSAWWAGALRRARLRSAKPAIARSPVPVAYSPARSAAGPCCSAAARPPAPKRWSARGASTVSAPATPTSSTPSTRRRWSASPAARPARATSSA